MSKITSREPAWKEKHKIGALMSRILKHAEGIIEMSPSQLNAAKLFLSKTLPDLARTELTGKDGDAIEHKDITRSDAEIIAQYMGKK
jgi:hypothetical protein